jgi:UDP-N-acetylmuramoyl-tripeptide--D-alanyl-D-alanine ligase
MHELTLAQVALAVGGEVEGDPHTVVRGIATDSRLITSGDLYCAIIGDRVDGHDYIDQALENGAVAVLMSRTTGHAGVLVPATDSKLDAVIIALGNLAGYQRTLMSDVVVVGVTGSSGKTSTKDIIGQVLENAGVTHAPSGSPNNELGLPLTLLQAPADTRYLVAEMGMRGLGHIKYLCDIAKPQIGVVTNVGHAHIGEVGSVEDIARAKAELVRALPVDGIAILNSDDLLVKNMAHDLNCKVVTYGLNERADVQARSIHTNADGTLEFTLWHADQEADVHLALLGEHNVSNALAAAAVGLAVGMSLAEVADALSRVERKSKWRMEVHALECGITLINDAYNANPESMAAALKTLASFNQHGRTWAVLGAMAELGDETIAEHDRIGRLAVRLNISQLVSIGDASRALFLGANQEGSWDGESVWFPNFAQASDYIVERAIPGDTILFKASRSGAFELLAQDVENRLNAQMSQKGT